MFPIYTLESSTVQMSRKKGGHINFNLHQASVVPYPIHIEHPPQNMVNVWAKNTEGCNHRLGL